MQGQLVITDSNYPKLLKEIKSPPKVLYYKGMYNESLFERCLAVVGSRRMTTYGRRAVQKLVYEIAGRGVTIVSGFMYGIDASAHKAALQAGGKTIAVMPCGIDRIHPVNQKELYEEILANDGLVLSEYKGLQQPQLWMYPQRNRIVAGLCKGALIVEAAVNSGSLITANYARKFGRKIFVVPGSIFSNNFGGIYQLICEGATVVASGDCVFELFGFGKDRVGEAQSFQLGLGLEDDLYVESSILEPLKFEPLTIDDLSRRVDLPFEELSSKLTLMLLNGFIFEEEGKYYAN